MDLLWLAVLAVIVMGIIPAYGQIAGLDASQVKKPAPVKQEPLKATCHESVYKMLGGYCDYVTLDNGTYIKNPNDISLVVVEVQKQPQSVEEQQQLTQKTLPPGGKCLGFQSSPTYCKNILMSDGSMILNKHWTLNVFTIDPNVLYANDPYVGSTDQTHPSVTAAEKVLNQEI